MRVVERSGKPLKNVLQRSHPFEDKKCYNADLCLVCVKSDKGGCRRENITYQIDCNLCDMVYVGETARNAYTRGDEHSKKNASHAKESKLWEHTRTYHRANDTPDYTMTITGTHSSALSRQLSEAVKINKRPPELTMNSRSEWGHTRLVRSHLTFK